MSGFRPLSGVASLRVRLAGLTHVDRHGEGPCPKCLHLGGDGEDGTGELLRRFGTFRGDHDVAPLARQTEGDGPPDAPTGPGNDRDATLEWRHDSPRPLG